MSNRTIEFIFDGIRSEIDAFEMHEKRAIKLTVKDKIDKAYITRAMNDCRILESILKANNEDAVKMVKSFFDGDSSTVDKLVEKLQLTEDAFQKKKGGWAAVLVFVAIMLYSSPARGGGGSSSGRNGGRTSGTRRGTT